MIFGEKFLAPQVEEESADHAYAGCAESVGPAEFLSQSAANQRREEGAQVHAHVVDAVSAVEARVAGRIEAAHLRREVGLEAAVADDQEEQAHQKHRFSGQEKLADGHEDGADHYSLALSQ